MVKTDLYEVDAERSGNWWALSVRGLRGVHSQVRRLEDAEEMVRDAIAFALEVDPGSFHVDVFAHVDPTTDGAFEAARQARYEAEQAQNNAKRCLQEAVVLGLHAGLPMRDIAHELGVSFQYVSKLARAGGTALTPTGVVSAGTKVGPRPVRSGAVAKAAPAGSRASKVTKARPATRAGSKHR